MSATRVLVAYAGRMGGTAGIAEAIGQTLRRSGHHVDVIDAAKVADVTQYGAVVLGSAIYIGRWRREAIAVLRLLADSNDHPPVWLFHSGPVGPDKDVQQPVPRTVARLAKKLGVESPKTFAGRLERHTARGLLARWMARTKLSGDSRDWAAIKQWTVGIHDSLQSAGRPGPGLANLDDWTRRMAWSGPEAPLRDQGQPLELSPDRFDAVLFDLDAEIALDLGALALIDRLEAAGLTVDVISAGDGAEALAGTSEPGVLPLAAQRLHVQPRRTVVIGDALACVEAGRAGGFGLVIGVDRTGQAADLTSHGADVVVADLAEVTVLASAGSGPGR
ncbi:flavodoxin domain-containing protein [Streptomyces sp. SID13031]|uniref:flavodoxin domain-containing protein n=1 Tax=Streptomyces sp. SID13031 TaxID=2706046 RepID=UPI00194193A3|nr:flavodoxin domain-containing protein [Streptomyces sp. SID13031]